MTARLRARLESRRSEHGYVAVMIAVMAPLLFLGLAATAVDTARWYVEVEKVQKAADAGALGGVPYMPQDLSSARTTAKQVTARNGYDDASSDVSVSVAQGARPSQLRVTVSSTIGNQFGQMIGIPQITITRSAVADYTGPAPMGSPCNTFSNEPSAGTGAVGTSPRPTGTARGPAPFPNCSSSPQFWATIEGPQVTKVQGDRYSTINCGGSGVEFCSAGKNDEYDPPEWDPTGYFWLIKVQAAAVGRPIDLQLYDPALIYTGNRCQDLPSIGSFSDNMNPYVTTDGRLRYGEGQNLSPTGASFCPGDYFPGGGSTPLTTSYVVREQTDTNDPMQGAPVAGCTKQFAGRNSAPSVNSLRSTSGSYDQQLAQVFHNWYSLCTFTPTREGDYYLQVRTNVSTGGSSVPNTNGNSRIIYSGNPDAQAANGNTTTGYGDNSFAIRAVTDVGLEKEVAVSGFARMPIFANATAAQSTFNLIRVLPGAAGQFISFSFFDVGDATSSGTVRVIPPADATGSITTNPFPNNCRAYGGGAPPRPTGTSLSNCTAPISNANNNGKVETIDIPIPADYNCNTSNLGGCWYQVEVRFPSGSVNDITTWDAQIVGDPVRLIE